MSLSTFANENAYSESSTGAILETRSANRLKNIYDEIYDQKPPPGFFGAPDYRHEFRESQIATIFWQIISESDYVKRLFKPTNRFTDDEIVVCQDKGQYSLLIFTDVQEFDKPETKEVKSLDISIGPLIKAWSRKIKNINLYLDSRINYFNFYSRRVMFDYYEELAKQEQVLENFVTESSNSQNFKIIIAKRPQRSYLSSLAPSPFAGITCDQEKPETSTAGVFTRNLDGVKGVTVALHSLNNPVLGQTIYIDNTAGKMISADPVSDSCFVELAILDRNEMELNGPLAGTTPRQYQSAFFEGLRTKGRKQAIIDSWSKDLPITARFNQLKVFTDLVANPGDSGAALIDNDKNIIGFSFYNTAISSPVTFTSWIWAESVFYAHNLIWTKPGDVL